MHALHRETIDLVGKRPWIDNNAVADNRKLSRPDHSGRQKAELERLAVDDERVAGVVAALETHHNIGARRQPVDDLALALVAPLGADHGDIRHPLNPSLQAA